ncbi:hypothetical protein KIW84_044877 [Lathyrus oleraceus]|uniref:PB1 domain-containing protein n=1 Tax=Pisum sativum TaxID=3888 RepID=A0A9D5AQY5_PEA|nr:hypothetical protein KIW84_044877 [Pisum sativum]
MYVNQTFDEWKRVVKKPSTYTCASEEANGIGGAEYSFDCIKAISVWTLCLLCEKHPATITEFNHPVAEESFESDGDADNTHVELPQPESLPNAESPHSSEPVADSHDTDVKQVSRNHLQEKNITHEELTRETSDICNQTHTIKYQLPGEDLDALISVCSDEDLHHMIEEYEELERGGGSQRLRILSPSFK